MHMDLFSRLEKAGTPGSWAVCSSHLTKIDANSDGWYESVRLIRCQVSLYKENSWFGSDKHCQSQIPTHLVLIYLQQLTI